MEIAKHEGIQAKSILSVLENKAMYDSKYTPVTFLRDLKKYFSKFNLTDAEYERYLQLPGKFKLEGHHPLCKFLGGLHDQELYPLPYDAHKAFHKFLREFLELKGFPLPVGSRKGSAVRWKEFFEKVGNEGKQMQAFDAVIEAAEKVDAAYSTKLTKMVKEHILNEHYVKYGELL